jgi:hypothetical protein
MDHASVLIDQHGALTHRVQHALDASAFLSGADGEMKSSFESRPQQLQDPELVAPPGLRLYIAIPVEPQSGEAGVLGEGRAR